MGLEEANKDISLSEENVLESSTSFRLTQINEAAQKPTQSESLQRQFAHLWSTQRIC